MRKQHDHIGFRDIFAVSQRMDWEKEMEIKGGFGGWGLLLTRLAMIVIYRAAGSPLLN